MFLAGESHGQRRLAGCSPWGCKELDKTDQQELDKISLSLEKELNKMFTNYKNTNHADSTLIADISASATALLIKDGDQSLFPSTFPFLLTLEHCDTDDNVILREIVKVTSSNQNSFTIVR